MIEGFEVPLHRSLTEPVLMAGAPRGLAISIGTLAAAVGLGLQLWISGLLIWLLGHSAAVFLARRDPDFMATLIRALRHKEHLSC
jgi:type IV secretory pathway TrbD component